jgi:trk system potassium uptake protein TrkA
VGKMLKNVHLPHECIIGAIVRPDGEVIVPRGEDTVEAGDRIICFALETSVPLLESAFLSESRS